MTSSTSSTQTVSCDNLHDFLVKQDFLRLTGSFFLSFVLEYHANYLLALIQAVTMFLKPGLHDMTKP